MSSLNTAIKFFQDCGLFIYPSVLIMVLGLAIAGAVQEILSLA